MAYAVMSMTQGVDGFPDTVDLIGLYDDFGEACLFAKRVIIENRDDIFNDMKVDQPDMVKPEIEERTHIYGNVCEYEASLMGAIQVVVNRTKVR